MDQLHTRLNALEQQMSTMHRRLRWWRGLACGLLALAVLTWALPSGTAQEDGRDGGSGLAQRLAALEQKLKHMTLVTAADNLPEVRITGANLRIVNGLAATETTNGLGNLIVGYNEVRTEGNRRTGSHNVIVGKELNYSRFGGIVVGVENEISGEFASVTGGNQNTATHFAASVSGGGGNTALGLGSSICGGQNNTADGARSSISGGVFNATSEDFSSVSGGQSNTAAGQSSSICGGAFNMARGSVSSVSGGQNRMADGEFDWVAGPLFADE